MASKSTDILMKVVRGGKALAGEAQTRFSVEANVDLLRLGFNPGFFSEIDDINFTIGSGGDKSEDLAKKLADPGLSPAEREKLVEKLKQSGAATARAGKVVDVEPVTFSRLMDISSVELFKGCVAAETFDSLSVIKRKATGGQNSGEAYLRLDFNKVLIINVDWDDDEHVVKEKWKFICREVVFKYRKQRDDGTLGSVVHGQWRMGG